MPLKRKWTSLRKIISVSDGLVVTKGKGRPKKEDVSTINYGPVYDRYINSFDGDGVKRSLKLSDDQSMLLAVAWVCDEELRLIDMFPEVLFMATGKEMIIIALCN